jgi:hypothetical protein
LLWVFSTHRSVTGAGIVEGKNGCGAPTARTTWSGVKIPIAVYQPRQATRDGRRRSSSEQVDVRGLLEQDRVTVLGVRADPDLVRHGAGRHVDRVLLAEEPCRLRLEPLHRRVAAIDVVADLGVRDGLARRRQPR